jgi:PAS domain S-box-containing protein
MGVQDVLPLTEDGRATFADRLQMAIERARILGITQEAAFHIRSVVEHLSDAILIVDEADRVVFANPAFEDMLGHSIEELYGAPCPFGLPERSGNAADMHILEWTRPDGTTLNAGVFISTLHWDGRAARMLAMRDLSAEHEVREVLLRARSTAEKTEELKASFLANMSHELRIPLASIIGFAEILAENAADDETREFATLIQESGGRLLRSINAVLDMTRLEAGRYEPVPEDVDVADVIDSAVRLMKPLADEKELELIRSGPSPLMFRTDPLFLERIVNNLVGNAIKFTGTGWVRVTWKTGEGGLTVLVQDTGIGISDAFLPELFDEFTQESTGRGRAYDGTGLGLAITRKLVERLGGTIDVSSQKGTGTSFTVTIPQSES